MDTILTLAASNLASAPVLFFVLGFAITLLGANLALPEGAAKMLSVYLMLAIGFKGGVALSTHGLTPAIGSIVLIGILLSALMPLASFALLGRMTSLGRTDRAAIAAHYGSISIVTFVAATTALKQLEIETGGYMVAVAAAMETPAILTALYLIASGKRDDNAPEVPRSAILKDVFLNMTIVVLLGSFAIGMATGEAGMADLKPFVADPFKGVLCLFLMDLGTMAGRSVQTGYKDIRAGLLAYAILMPLIGAGIGLTLAQLTGLAAGDTALLMTLAASASYIAVPAAMRIAVPQARPSLSLVPALGITFPFNLVLGIPAYIALARWLA